MKFIETKDGRWINVNMVETVRREKDPERPPYGLLYRLLDREGQSIGIAERDFDPRELNYVIVPAAPGFRGLILCPGDRSDPEPLIEEVDIIAWRIDTAKDDPEPEPIAGQGRWGQAIYIVQPDGRIYLPYSEGYESREALIAYLKGQALAAAPARD